MAQEDQEAEGQCLVLVQVEQVYQDKEIPEEIQEDHIQVEDLRVVEEERVSQVQDQRVLLMVEQVEMDHQQVFQDHQ